MVNQSGFLQELDSGLTHHPQHELENAEGEHGQAPMWRDAWVTEKASEQPADPGQDGCRVAWMSHIRCGCANENEYECKKRSGSWLVVLTIWSGTNNLKGIVGSH